MAGKIIADIIEAPYNRITLNVGNTVVATMNASGLYTSTGNLLITQAGTVQQAAMFSGFKNGITESDSWRITSDLTATNGTSTDLTTNWERNDTTGYEKIGTGMSQSSGIFTFPSTGYWEIDFVALLYRNISNVRYAIYSIYTTTNNSTYVSASEAWGFMLGQTFGNTSYVTTNNKHLFKVTDTTLCKVKFNIFGVDTFSVAGSSDKTYTGATFKRIGDL